MASFKTLSNGKIRAFVCINGVRDTKTLNNKQKAKSWAREREVELNTMGELQDDSRTFGDVFRRYADELSPSKKGARWEIVRLNMLLREFKPLCALRLIKSQKSDIQDWMAQRRKTVVNSTINRELNLISHCLTVAREEWGWMSHNPLKGLKRPKNPKARNRRINENEIREICLVLGYRDDTELMLKREFTGAAFLFAIETAMRAGEICSLTSSNINFKTQVAHLEKTKNGDERFVPLSDRAIEILRQLPASAAEAPIFQLTSQSLSATLRKYRLKTSIEDLTFHDARHEATTRLSSQLHVLSLAKVTGHRNINELMTYYNESAEDIVKKLKTNVSAQSVSDVLSAEGYATVVQQLLKDLTKVAHSQSEQ